MIRQNRRALVALLFGGTTLWTTPAVAATNDFIDLQAGLGYSSNPFLRLDNNSSAFGRLSIYGQHAWQSEKGKTSLSAYLENTTYFNHYGSKQIFDLNAHTQQAVSETVSIFGNATFSGDFAGQLSNRLYFVPSEPPPGDVGNPLPPPTNNPDLIGLSGRQYRVSGEVGASIRAGPKGTVSIAAGAERLIFTGNNEPPDYNIFFGSLGYHHQVSARTQVGGSVYFQRQDFAGSDYSNVINPVVTLHSQLSETLVVDAEVGALVIERHHGGDSRTSTTPSFRLGLCSRGTVSSFCGHVSRDAQSALGTGIPNTSGQSSITTEGGLNYYRQLNRDDTLQASLTASHYSTPDPLPGQNFQSTYLSTVLGYDHKFGQRFSAGVHLGARELYQPGPNPNTDFNGSLYLRYRIGQLL